MVAPIRTGSLEIIDAGLLAYAAALELQHSLAQARRQERSGDRLILLEHPPVITLGQSGGLEDLRVPAAELVQRGVALFETGRGGRATFHGPGQLVAYPILRLYDGDLHAYLWRLEDVVLRVLDEAGIPAQREERYPGVWVGTQKIAAVGVAVSGEVTMHGLALNVSTDLAYFDLITPCGIQGRGVTSMLCCMGSSPPMPAVKAMFIRHFCNVFDLQVIDGSILE